MLGQQKKEGICGDIASSQPGIASPSLRNTEFNPGLISPSLAYRRIFSQQRIVWADRSKEEERSNNLNFKNFKEIFNNVFLDREQVVVSQRICEKHTLP